MCCQQLANDKRANRTPRATKSDFNKAQVLLKADEDLLKKQQQLFASEAGHLIWHQNRWLEDKAAVDKEIAESAAARAAAVTKMLDGIQTTLDLAGFALGVGAVPDVINAMISAGRGNFGEAAINLAAAIPGPGD